MTRPLPARLPIFLATLVVSVAITGCQTSADGAAAGLADVGANASGGGDGGPGSTGGGDGGDDDSGLEDAAPTAADASAGADAASTPGDAQVALTPDESAFQAALVLYDGQQYAEAQSALEQFLTDYPTSVRADNATYLVARCRFELRDFVDARARFTAFLATFPDSSLVDDARYYLARCAYELAEFAVAAGEFTRFVAAFPDSALVDNAQYYLARCDYEIGDFAGAIAACDAVISIGDSDQRDGCLYWAARAADAWGEQEGPGSARFADAERYFETLFTDYPGGVYEDNGRYGYGMVAYHREDFPTALDRLDAMRRDFPRSTYADNAWYFSTRCRYHLADYATAITEFEAFIAASPASDYLDDSTYYLGRSHYELARQTGDSMEYEAALVVLDVVTTDFSDGLYGDNAWYYKLRSHIALGRCAEAQQDADALAARYPDSTYNAQAQSHLATDC